MKIKKGTASLFIAIVALAFFSGLNVFIFREMRDSSTLVSANENERILNTLFASLKDHVDFGSAIESDTELRDRVIGVMVYGRNGETVYAWGKVQRPLGEAELRNYRSMTPGRYTVPDKADGSLKFIIRTSKMGPPPPRHEGHRRMDSNAGQTGLNGRMTGNKVPFFFYIFENGEWLHIEIRHTAYWREQTLMDFLFPICELFLAFIVFYIRHLVIRNGEYRERIEGQKSLVVLGTAASTLAHEIKNPLLAIRLQTSILGRICEGKGENEISIINSEVDRLSMLTYRVNDYLREPKGSPCPMRPAELLREIQARMCGKDVPVMEGDRTPVVYMDTERFRSVFENIMRNAIESGSPSCEIEVRCGRKDGMVEIEVLDRGKGINETDCKRIFDPFFTTKSSGTGIGLTICQRFVQAAGGTILLTPREGGGTSVAVRIPEYRNDDVGKAG